MAEIDKYCAVWDYNISDVVYKDGVSASAGGAGVEEIAIPGRSYGDVRAKGRAPKRYRIKARSWDRTELETLARTESADAARQLVEDVERLIDRIRRDYVAIAYRQGVVDGAGFKKLVAAKDAPVGL